MYAESSMIPPIRMILWHIWTRNKLRFNVMSKGCIYTIPITAIWNL